MLAESSRIRAFNLPHIAESAFRKGSSHGRKFLAVTMLKKLRKRPFQVPGVPPLSFHLISQSCGKGSNDSFQVTSVLSGLHSVYLSREWK